MDKFEIDIKKETQDKIYFDLIYDELVRINYCFVERGQYGDLMLRLPTKKTDIGIHQTVFIDDKNAYEEIREWVTEYFKGRLT